jgi:hypothetical protein
MKMRTILLSVLLSIATLQAFAVTFRDGDFEFEENGATTCTLVNYSRSGQGGDIILSSGVTKTEANGKTTLVVTAIGYRAFAGHSNITSITIPNSVTVIGDWAFYYTGLTKITVEWATPLPVSSNTFSGVNPACILDVPQGTANKYKAAPVWKDFIIQNHTGITALPSPQPETLACYPNPAKDYATVRYELPEQSALVVLRIYDMQGKLVLQTNPQHQAAGINETYINVGTLSKGVYVVTLSNGKGYSQTKLLKE